MAHSAPGGIVVTVRAAPKARREGIEGIEARPRGAALKIAIATAPTEGRANKRLADIAKAVEAARPTGISLDGCGDDQEHRARAGTAR